MNREAPADTLKTLYGRVFVLALCLTAFAAVFVPRILGFAPGVIGIAGFLAFRPVFGRWPEISVSLLAWLAAIAGLAAASAFWAVDPDAALERAGAMSALFMSSFLLLCTAQSLEGRYLAFVKNIFPGLLILAGILCAAQIYSGGALYKTLYEGLQIPLKDSFNLSFFNRGVVVLTLLFFPALALVMEGKNPREKIIAGALVLTLLAVVLRTDSQSVQLAAVVGAIFFFLFPYRHGPAWFALCGGVAAGFFACPWLAEWMFRVLPPLLGDSGFAHDSYAAQRLEIWNFISRRALESPFSGYGIEATKSITDFQSGLLYFPSARVLHPHNFAVQVWIEFGLTGAALAAAFTSFLVLKVKEQPASLARLMLPALMATLSIAATSYGLWQGWWLGAFFLAASFWIFAVKLAGPRNLK